MFSRTAFARFIPCSSDRRRRFVQLAAAALVAGLLAGCASSGASPVQLRATEFGRAPVPPGHPIVLAFKAGDRIPVVFDMTGEIVEITPRPSELWLTAKRDFYLRIDGSSLKTSLDGVHFSHPRKPGTFRIGLGPQPSGGAKVEVSIVTPVHAQ